MQVHEPFSVAHWQPHRRHWLAGALGVAGMAAWMGPSATTAKTLGIDPLHEIRKPGELRASLSAYSVRDLLKNPHSEWNLFRFVDYCRELLIAGAELTSYYFPTEVDDAYLTQLKRYCHRNGITISGGAIANDFCQTDDAKRQSDIETTKRWIDRYAVLGAPVIRIFAGGQPSGEDWTTTRDRCVRAIEEVAQYAAQRGIYLGLENHGGVTATADRMLEIVQRVQSDGFGVNLDSGNFRSSEDPYAELAKIAPYAVNAQLKVEMFPMGKKEWTDIPRVLRILNDSGYSGWVALEYEASEPPLESIPRWISELKKHLKERTN